MVLYFPPVSLPYNKDSTVKLFMVCPVERKLTTGFPELDSLIDSNPRGTILFVLQDQQSNFLWIGTWSARVNCVLPTKEH